MSRRSRLLIGLLSIIVLMALAYASLPWLLSTMVKRTLAAQGLRDLRLSIDYPRWRGIRVHGLGFTTVAGGRQIRVQSQTADIEYHLSTLVTGRIDSIQVPITTVHIQPFSDGTASSPANASGHGPTALPLAALVSGQWLAQLPLRALSLERVSIKYQYDTNTEYTLHVSAQLHDEQLQLNGDITLPPLPNSIVFSVNADSTGKESLIFSSKDHAEKPLLAVAVTSVDVDQDPMIVNGDLHTSLKPLAPLLGPWLKQIKQVSGIEGEFNSKWQARINDSRWQLSGEAMLQGIGGHWRNLAIPASEAKASFAADAHQVSLHASLSTADHAVVLQADGAHQFASARGHATLRLIPVEFAKSGFMLSHVLQTWPYPFDVDAGRAAAVAHLQWHNMIQTKLDLHLENLGGHYKKMTFGGLSGQMALTMDKGIATLRAALVHADSLNVGFPLENIAMQFALSPSAQTGLPVVRVEKFSAELLGGRARSGPFVLDFTRDKNAFTVQLEHISLSDIMLLERQEGLEGSGLVDGTIPITISREGIEVTHGQLAARVPGGVIRYTPTPKVASLARTNSSVNMVVEALRNFHYQVMEVHSTYKAKGDLDLKVHLEGNSPDWRPGQLVHLNLNLQENIPALLRSLQLSGEISERLRQHYQNTH